MIRDFSIFQRLSNGGGWYQLRIGPTFWVTYRGLTRYVDWTIPLWWWRRGGPHQ